MGSDAVFASLVMCRNPVSYDSYMIIDDTRYI